MAYQMLTVAVGWQIYALTGSALRLGLVGLVQFLPAFALVLVVGHIADRFDRRRILCACQGVAVVAVTILGAGSAMGWVTEHVIFALVFVIGCARAFEMPTMQALLPALVPQRLLPRAVASSASASQTAIILGPAAGGGEAFISENQRVRDFADALQAADLGAAGSLMVASDPWGGLPRSLWLSVITGALTAVVGGLAFQSIFMVMLFGSLAYSSYLALQQVGGGGRGRPW